MRNHRVKDLAFERDYRVLSIPSRINSPTLRDVAVILTPGCRISLAVVGGNSTGTASDQGKKKGNVGEHGIADFPAGNGLDGLEAHDASVECCNVEEVRAWGSSFDRLMKSAAGRNVFNEFLKSEYSEENIAFWMACEQLKRESNPKIIVEMAKYIYNTHISIISPKEVSTLFVRLSLSRYSPTCTFALIRLSVLAIYALRLPGLRAFGKCRWQRSLCLSRFRYIQ